MKKESHETNRRSETIVERVAKMTDELRAGGYEFDLREVDNEFVLFLGEKGAPKSRELHILRVDPMEVMHGSEVVPCRIEDVLRARIINPDGNLYDTIHSEEFRNSKGQK